MLTFHSLQKNISGLSRPIRYVPIQTWFRIHIGNKNDDEYYDEPYMVETSPRYFIRPAIEETLQEVGILINQELKEQYLQYRRQTNGDDIL